MINRYFQKYKGFLRSLKLVYFVNNFFSKRKLEHNKELYKKYGLQKSIFSSIGTKDFQNRSDEIPWIDEPNAKLRVNEMLESSNLKDISADQINAFIDDGFLILKSFFSLEEIEKHNEIIKELKSKDQIDFNYTQRKINQVHLHSEYIEQKFFKNKNLLQLFNFLLGKEIIPFHTIHFMEGSEQRAHSDSIHMSTEPEGYLIAAWIALEPTDQDNGPLFYYPGSHRLPYLSCLDYESGNTKWFIGGKYSKYEDKVDEIIKEKKYKKEYFYAETGDVLIWHANLLHGGNPINDAGRTRKSMVAHYFGKDVICYHEITQRPALINSSE